MLGKWRLGQSKVFSYHFLRWILWFESRVKTCQHPHETISSGELFLSSQEEPLMYVVVVVNLQICLKRFSRFYIATFWDIH